MEPGLHSTGRARRSSRLVPPQQDADVVASLVLVQQVSRNIHAGAGGLCVSLMPTISISSPTLMMPR